METPNLNIFDRLKNWVRYSVSLRIFSIAFLVLLLMIPASMIDDLIWERQNRQEEVVKEVSAAWSNAQTLTGPFITVPYKYYVEDDGDTKVLIQYAHFLPDQLSISGDIQPEMRYRSIYKVAVYQSTMELKGRFTPVDMESLGVPAEDMIWEDAYLSMGISDLRGIGEKVALQWNGTSYPFDPGLRTNDLASSGMGVRIGEAANGQEPIDFSFSLELKGSRTVSFVPLGKETKVNISSSWTAPSFYGAFLPEKEIDTQGFQANWRVLHLNRNFPQQWTGNSYSINGASFGVELLIPVDQYQKTQRSSKYAILFIGLTFLVFFFIEILNDKRIHPIQYILIGLSLVIFYVLLLSISEHFSFGWAFLVAASMVTLLISIYARAIFKQGRLTMLLAGLLVLLYGFLYTILQLESHALLVGSLGLFLVLATVMYLSRKIDWYEVGQGKMGNAGRQLDNN